jgi:hypothetical protein
MRIILVRGQNFASGGQIFTGGQNFASGGQIFASLGPNSKFKKINFFQKSYFSNLIIFQHFLFSLVSEFDLNFIPR